VPAFWILRLSCAMKLFFPEYKLPVVPEVYYYFMLVLTFFIACSEYKILTILYI
jgi:hypothetical protein